jgi:thiol-disulfide isomerase/thioredoxin
MNLNKTSKPANQQITKSTVLLSFLFLLQSVFVFALKPVVIEGQATFAKNNQLRFYFYNDLFLQEKVLCATTKVDKEGNFRVEIQTNETVLLTLAFQSTYGQIFIEPEKKYKIELSITNENLLKRIDANMLGNAIEIRITSTDTMELNYKINRFEWYYNHFLYLYSDDIYEKVPEQVYDSLIGLLTKKFPVNEKAIDYYSVYIRYKIAYIDLLYYDKNKEKLYKKYLNSEYVFYNNIAYMDFLDNFFDGYLYAGMGKIPRSVLYENINEKRDYYKLLNEMGKDPLLVNEKIRELVFIKGLGELCTLDNEFSQTNILFLLSQMNKISKFAEHRKMADNLAQNLTKLKSGTKIPDFELKDVYNSPVKISSFEGRYLYLHFFSTYCEDCIRDMLVLKSLQEKYKDSLRIVSIMVDFEQASLYHFVKTYKEFNWTFLHFGGNFSFIDAYGIYSLPLGILIDSQGKIVSYPAKSPKHGLVEQIFSIFPTVEAPKQPDRNRY